MILRYKRSHLQLLLGLGLVLLVSAFVMYYLGAREFVGVFLAMGIYNIGLYIFRSTRHYLSVHNGTIRKSGLFARQIALKDIRRIKRFAGDLTIEGTHGEIPVYTAFLDVDSLRRFERKLREFETDEIGDQSTNDTVTT